MNAIVQRSISDPEFRRALVEDPKTAIHDAFGIRIPDEFRVKFIEKGPDLDALIVLPDPAVSDELSDDELDSVAGGVTGSEYRWAPPPGPSLLSPGGDQ
ncbi:MAG TPA: NHLP leader peptide family RiPP precursor [Vicinamibacterales bacterium]